MNIYKNIINIANYHINDEIIKEYMNLLDKLRELKNDTDYNDFFCLVDAKSCYYFYAPNVALQIIRNVKTNKDYGNPFTEESCNKIINNEIINKYAEVSTKVNELVIGITKRIFVSLDEFATSEENYIYNRCSDELGYLGFGKIIQNFSNSNNVLENYEKERGKIIHDAKFIFPFAILKSGLYQDFENKVQFKEIVRNYENFNIILTIINIILFSCLSNKIVNIGKSEINILKIKRKENVKKITFLINNAFFLVEFPIIIELEGEIYFRLNKHIKFENKKVEIICEYFSINFEKMDSLLNFSINNLSILL